jgi:quinol-cytochrome oxidoreductase complex cytochrome b subunit
LAMFGSIFILVLLPWLDRSPVRSARYRPVFRQFFWLLVADCVLLTFAGGRPPEGTWLIMSRLGTAYYFFHFLVILPLVGWLERPDPLPISLSTPALMTAGPRSPA